MSPAMKRFYKAAAAAPAGPSDHGYLVELDGRPVRTPLKAPLAVPTRGLAEAIAEEWAAQEGDIRPQAMPLSGLACNAIDRVAVEQTQVAEQIAAYAAHDLVCYRVAEPPELAARQAAVWQPLLDWVAVTYGAPLATTCGLAAAPHPPEALAALRRTVFALDHWRLTGLGSAVQAAGSLVVGLALRDRRLSAEAAFAASQVDEDFQIERWGEDPEAAARRASLLQDLAAAARFLELLDA